MRHAMYCVNIGIDFVLTQVHSFEDRDEALKHDRGYIGKRYVTVRVVTEQSMKDSISRNSAKVIFEH